MADIILDSVRDRLIRKAHLYGDPTAFKAGVEAALASVAAEQNTATIDLKVTEVLSVPR